MAVKKPVVLLMTATITPPLNCPNLKRTNPSVRLNDYCNAFIFYLMQPIDLINRIIFVENSDTDLTPLRNLAVEISHEKSVEFISFPEGNCFPVEYGKGYGEILMINYALSHSKIICKNDIIWKATGRLILNNIASLIRSSANNFDVYCDLHNSFKMFKLEAFFDPRFFAFSFDSYEKYFGSYVELLKFQHIENYFYNTIQAELHNGNAKIIPRFKRQPLIKGFAGSLDKDYLTFGKQLQRSTQQLFRTLFPWFWV
jgi:hypothetical protein